jgi:hypothetical protein
MPVRGARKLDPTAGRFRSTPVAPADQRWLVFVHQLPAHPSNARVKTWRRLQQIGAVAVKNAVYVLPNTAQTHEDFEWLRTEVIALGGQATIFEASSISGVEERQIIKQFRAARTENFAGLNKEVKAIGAQLRQRFRSDDESLRAIRALRDRYEELRRIDFFGSAGGDQVAAALGRLEARSGRTPKSPAQTEDKGIDRREYVNRTWITRPRPGVDRFASAWMIRRFIDPDARFTFAVSAERHPDAVPFDMYQSGGFKHEGDLCTFEVLQNRLAVNEPAVRRIAEIVHDLDLKDDRFKSPHAPTIGSLVEGLRASFADDAKLLEQGMALFEALYQSLQPAKRPRSGKTGIC